MAATLIADLRKVSLPKARLTRFVGRLSSRQTRDLDRALAALDIDVESLLG